MLSSTRIQLCGRIAIEFKGRRLESELPGAQGRLLFVYLALNRGRVVGRDELAAALWPAGLPAKADSNLRVVVSRLRRVLGPDVITGRTELRLVLPVDAWVDIEVAADKVHEAESAVEAEDWSRALPAAWIAYAISGRAFLLTEEGTEWVDEQRRWLEDVHVRALECHVAASLGFPDSELATAEQEARRLIELSPYRETGYRLLMDALQRRGNSAEALLVFDRLRTLLRDELGVGPSAATRELHRRLLEEGA